MCQVWVPSVYTSPALFLTKHPYQLGAPLALAIFAAGVAAIYINWDADRQRQVRPHLDALHKHKGADVINQRRQSSRC